MGDFIKKQFATFKNYVVNSLTAASIGRWFISTIFLLVTILLLLLALAKGIDASFVSAVMDSIMAGTAILAVLAAKNYLAQFTAQEGYKIAISLVNDDLLLIPEMTKMFKKYKAAYVHISCMQKIYASDVDIKVCEQEIVDLKNDHAYYESVYSTIYKKKRQLDTYGLHLIDSKSSDFDKMMREYKTILDFVDSLIGKYEKIIGSIKELNLTVSDDLSVFKGGQFVLEKSLEPAATMLVREHFCNINTLYRTIVYSNKRSERHIFKLFVIR